MSTILCGSTVEWEVAALTMAFLGGSLIHDRDGADNTIQLGSESINIKCYQKRCGRYGTKIATAYIETLRR